MCPGRQHDTEHRAAGHIGILVEGNAYALCFGFIQELQHAVDVLPVLPAAYLEMGKMHLDARFPAYAQDFLHGFQDRIRLTALMDDKNTIILSHHSAKLNEFLCSRIGTGM